MDPIVVQMLTAGAVELLILPILIFVMKHFLGKRLDHFDEKRDLAREERAEEKRREREQQEAEHNIILAISRSMLLDNYEKCMKKGFYSVDEREIYHFLYQEYKNSGGNGIIDTLGEHIRELPTDPPKNSPFLGGDTSGKLEGSRRQ